MAFLGLSRSTWLASELGLTEAKSTEAELTQRDPYVDQKHPNLARLQTILQLPLPHVTMPSPGLSTIRSIFSFCPCDVVCRTRLRSFVLLMLSLLCPCPLLPRSCPDTLVDVHTYNTTQCPHAHLRGPPCPACFTCTVTQIGLPSWD